MENSTVVAAMKSAETSNQSSKKGFFLTQRSKQASNQSRRNQVAPWSSNTREALVTVRKGRAMQQQRSGRFGSALLFFVPTYVPASGVLLSVSQPQQNSTKHNPKNLPIVFRNITAGGKCQAIRDRRPSTGSISFCANKGKKPSRHSRPRAVSPSFCQSPLL